ncbi:hypothetical protein CLF_103558 [Clonorchis sinensis]|uniref:Uncharacterized protein n=1 Tax=Clonorchis sinensis TaxID=79923 RepID=G7YNJ4_CLOSI|nr:hypothetical protein CLF_103558 [Clonorchis sinensis]
MPYDGFLPNAAWSNLAPGSPDRTSSITNGTSTTQLLVNYKNDQLCKGLQVLPTVYHKPRRTSGGGAVTGVHLPTQERVRGKPHIPEEFLIKLPVSTARNRGNFVTEDVEVDRNTCAYMTPSCSIKENGCCKAGDQSDDGKSLISFKYVVTSNLPIDPVTCAFAAIGRNCQTFFKLHKPAGIDYAIKITLAIVRPRTSRFCHGGQLQQRFESINLASQQKRTLFITVWFKQSFSPFDVFAHTVVIGPSEQLHASSLEGCIVLYKGSDDDPVNIRNLT